MGGDSPALPIARHIHLLATWNFLLFGVTMVLFGDRPRQRRGVGAADHPRHRPGPGPLRLHLRRPTAGSAPTRSGPASRSARSINLALAIALLPARRLEEGADDGRDRADDDECIEEALRHARARRRAQPGGLARHRREAGSSAIRSAFAMTRDDRFLPCPAHAPRPRRARGCARCSPSTGCTRATSSGRLFICEGRDCEEPIGSLPGVSRWSVDRLAGQGARGRRRSASRASRLFPNTPERRCAPSDARGSAQPRQPHLPRDQGDQGRGAGDRRADRRRARSLHRARPRRAHRRSRQRHQRRHGRRSSSSRRWSRPRPAPTSSLRRT